LRHQTKGVENNAAGCGGVPNAEDFPPEFLDAPQRWVEGSVTDSAQRPQRELESHTAQRGAAEVAWARGTGVQLGGMFVWCRGHGTARCRITSRFC